jgi:hypothetical protein
MNIFKKISEKISKKKPRLVFIISSAVLLLSVIGIYLYSSGLIQSLNRKPEHTSRPGKGTLIANREDRTKENLEKLNRIISDKMKKAMEQIQPEIVYQKYISMEDLKLDMDGLKNRSKGTPKHKMVVLMDFACGICNKVSSELKQRLEENKNRLQITYILFPLDKKCNTSIKGKYSDYSCFSAELALCAEKEGKFFESFDYLYTNRPSSKVIDENSFINTMSKDLGLKDLKACMSSSWLKERIASENAYIKNLKIPEHLMLS